MLALVNVESDILVGGVGKCGTTVFMGQGCAVVCVCTGGEGADF